METPEEMTVTEAEWLVATDPESMLECVEGKASERKLRLFTVACCRRVWPNTGKHGRRAVEVAERYADGQTTERELKDAEHVASHRPYAGDDAARAACMSKQGFSIGQVALVAILAVGPQAAQAAERIAQTRTLRCIFGNPLRPAPEGVSVHGSWRGNAVTQIARAAYEECRLQDGTLDPSRLVVLADALEDAGCTDSDLLGHVRSPGPHVRGCWAVDLVLGKS
jgi:hypothetical protein